MMKIAGILALIALALLSLAAGGAKVAQMPQEAAFFTNAGIDPMWMIPLGLVQVVGAIACIFQRFRRLGLIAIGFGFLASSLMIITTGNIQFGLISLIPVALCGLLYRITPAESAS